MARKFWPQEDAIGRRFRALGVDEGWFTVVGIVPDYRHGELADTEPVEPCAYVSLAESVFANTGLTVRAAGDPASLAASLRAALRASDPKIAVFNMRTMEDVRARGYWQYFLFGWMFSLFGGIALALAAIGVYGVLSYSVAQRTQEIGVRVALGASRADVLTLVVVQGGRLAMVGVAIGLAGSFFVTPVIQSQLVNVSAKDPASFIGVSVFLTAVAFAASYVPARRATAVDPLVALRSE
jgi:putative ABC transport system permease protein